jgi:hypothetical protein
MRQCPILGGKRTCILDVFDVPTRGLGRQTLVAGSLIAWHISATEPSYIFCLTYSELGSSKLFSAICFSSFVTFEYAASPKIKPNSPRTPKIDSINSSLRSLYTVLKRILAEKALLIEQHAPNIPKPSNGRESCCAKHPPVGGSRHRKEMVIAPLTQSFR